MNDIKLTAQIDIKEEVRMNMQEKAVFISLILVGVMFFLGVDAQSQEKLEKGIQLFEKGQYSEAKEFFESYINQHPKSTDAAFYIGKIFFMEKDYDPSIDWFKKAVEMDQDSSEYHLWLGRAYAMKTQKVSLLEKVSLAKECKFEFDKAVELDPDNIDARFNLIGFYLQAPSFLGGSTDRAMEQVEEIKKRDKKSGHRALRMVYEAEGKYDLVEKELLSEMKEDPQSMELHYQLGYFYTNQKKYDEAYQIFEKILKVSPEEMNAYYQVGRIGSLSGQNVDWAEECLKKYLKYKPEGDEPSLAWAHYRLGLLYEHKGEKELAKTEYEKALGLDPGHAEAKKALEKLGEGQ